MFLFNIKKQTNLPTTRIVGDVKAANELGASKIPYSLWGTKELRLGFFLKIEFFAHFNNGMG